MGEFGFGLNGNGWLRVSLLAVGLWGGGRFDGIRCFSICILGFIVLLGMPFWARLLGFRFYPTDEELVVHFLHRKAALLPFHPDVIPDLDLYPYDPWELDGKAMVEGNKWYFFSRKTQNWITENGYWKPLGVDEPVFTSDGKKVGMKKHYVFYVREAPAAEVKTNWIMQEFRLPDCSSTSSSSGRSSKRRGNAHIDYSTWVLCRVYERIHDDDNDSTELSTLDEVFLSLDDLDEISLPN